MVKIFATILLATSVYATAACAHGGGAEPMPGTNFTDMPPYHAMPFAGPSDLAFIPGNIPGPQVTTDIELRSHPTCRRLLNPIRIVQKL